jgi:hypothetical protein
VVHQFENCLFGLLQSLYLNMSYYSSAQCVDLLPLCMYVLRNCIRYSRMPAAENCDGSKKYRATQAGPVYRHSTNYALTLRKVSVRESASKTHRLAKAILLGGRISKHEHFIPSARSRSISTCCVCQDFGCVRRQKAVQFLDLLSESPLVSLFRLRT